MKKIVNEYYLPDGKILTTLTDNIFYTLLNKFKKNRRQYTNIIDFKYWLKEKSHYYKVEVRGNI